MAAITSFSTAALSLCDSHAIWRTIVNGETLSNEACTTHPPRFLKNGKGRLVYFSINGWSTIPCSKEYFPVFTCCAIWL